MKISQLCLLLQKYYPCSFMYDDPDAEVYSFKPLSPSVSPAENYLYICEESTVCPDSLSGSGTVTNILLYAENEKPLLPALRESAEHVNLIWVQKNREETLSSLYDILNDIFLSENRYTSEINRLTQLSASGRGMHALISEAARMLKAYIIVIDSSYQLLSMSSFQEVSEVSALEEQRKLGAVTEANLLRLQREHIFEKIRREPDRMFYNIAMDAVHWWVNMLVYVHGIEVAEVGIMEVGRKFTEYDFELIKHLRHLISLELERGKNFGETFGFSHNILVAELLDKPGVSPDLLRYRSGLLGWPSTPFYYVLALFPNTDEDQLPAHFHRKAQVLSVQLSRQMPRSYWRIGARDLVYIIPREERDGQVLLQNPRLSELLTGSNMLGILSNPVSDLMKIRDAYRQTTVLNSLREYLPGRTPLHQYADYSILHIASILQQSHQLESFYHPLLLMIRDYDHEYHTDYTATLYEYLLHIDDPSAIAEHLHIHKNTVYYRINKIKELFPMNLNDGSLRMKLLVSMEMMRLETPFT